MNNKNLAGGKPSSTTTTTTTTARKPQEPPVKCPRCDSPNTKFCYYNNYSLSQPRHFCKTCRRYWTKGGALRNVPIGGGSRRNKKTKSPPAHHHDDSTGGPSGLKFFQNIPPAMDFHLGAINTTPDIFNNFSSFTNLSPLESSVTGFSFPLSSSSVKAQTDRNVPLGFQEIGHSNFGSSLECLSSINQDLHWKLQQQRLASLFVEQHKPQPILFQNLEISKKDGGNGNGNLSTELLFSNSYAAAPPTSGGNNWSGITQAWNELNHFTSLP